MKLEAVTTLAELIEYLKEEHGYSNEVLAKKSGLGKATIYKMSIGLVPKTEVLDRLAVYAGVTREWLYSIALNLKLRSPYSPTINMLAALLEPAPEDIQQQFLAQARAVVEHGKANRKPQE